MRQQQQVVEQVQMDGLHADLGPIAESGLFNQHLPEPSFANQPAALAEMRKRLEKGKMEVQLP